VLRLLVTFSAVAGRALGTVFGSLSPLFHSFLQLTGVIQPTLQGLDAVDALLEATPDTPSYMIGMRENRVHRVPLVEAVKMVPLYCHRPSALRA
jgi:hypothetical protein